MIARDYQRCFNGAAYGATTGDHTQNTCPEHVVEIIDSMITRHAQAVMIYAMQTKRRCDWRYDKRTEPEPERTGACSAHLVIGCDADECQQQAEPERTAARSPYTPPHIPASYCRRCANSGVGVCDDYPNCPAGQKASGQ